MNKEEFVEFTRERFLTIMAAGLKANGEVEMSEALKNYSLILAEQVAEERWAASCYMTRLTNDIVELRTDIHQLSERLKYLEKDLT